MKILGVILLAVFLLFLLGIGPVLTILSLNTLFNTSIAVSVWSWLSVAWLHLIAAGAVRGGIKLARAD